MLIKNAVIFGVGTHNGIGITTSDLDGMVENFNTRSLSGKLPIKYGHTAGKGQPACGWIMRVARDGDRLVADLDINDAAATKVKNGEYRFSSVELILDYTDDDGRLWKYQLEGLAILGAERPAVEGVSDLRALAATRKPNPGKWVIALDKGAKPETETEGLRAELAAAQKQMAALAMEHAIASGRILPRDREMFFKRYPTGGTMEEAQEWINTTTKPFKPFRAAVRDGEVDYAGAFGGPDKALVAKGKAYFERHRLVHFQLHGEHLTLDRALEIVALDPANRELLRASQELTGDTTGVW